MGRRKIEGDFEVLGPPLEVSLVHAALALGHRVHGHLGSADLPEHPAEKDRAVVQGGLGLFGERRYLGRGQVSVGADYIVIEINGMRH